MRFFLVLFCLGVLSPAGRAEPPHPAHHPRLLKAYKGLSVARDEMARAQVANPFLAKGHGARLRALIDEAIREAEAAAQAADAAREFESN